MCQPTETIAAVKSRIDGWAECVVVNGEHVVLGLLRKNVWEEAEPGIPAEQVMDLAPQTFRPHVTREEMARYMQSKKLKTALVTTPEGKLFGLVRRKDLR
jgi:Mg/Co/Ni transporter MgtE